MSRSPAQQPAFEAKVCASEDIVSAINTLARPIVFTNGVFDVLHRGHVSYLAQARSMGASLVVGLNTDASVRRLGKGADRPVNREEDRAAVLAALESTSLITYFSQDTPYALIERIRPDILVKGGDYDMDVLAEATLVRSWGGSAHAVEFLFERSTTDMLKRIRASA